MAYLSKYFDYEKPFKEMIGKDIAEYLGSMHRDQTVDPDQKWVNTHNTMTLSISKFYRWVAYPHLSPQERKKLRRDQLQLSLRSGLTFVAKKGSKGPVKAKHIWTDQDNALFLKYCTEGRGDKRLACYHALAMDTSARPDELIELKIGDIEIKKTPDGSGRLDDSLDIGRYGKKKRSRIVPLINSILYYREWLQAGHSSPGNPNAFMFMSREYSSRYRNLPISVVFAS